MRHDSTNSPNYLIARQVNPSIITPATSTPKIINRTILIERSNLASTIIEIKYSVYLAKKAFAHFCQRLN
jgi:hypothetical protein